MTDFSKCFDAFALKLSSLQTQATPRLLMNVFVTLDKKQVKLTDLCQIAVENPTLLTISVDSKKNKKPVEKAIQQSNLGLSVQDDGENLRVMIPKMTVERKAELMRMAKSFLEEAKTSVKMERQKSLDGLKSEKRKDVVDRSKKTIDQETNAAVTKLEKMLSDKDKEMKLI
jgi:ribosome recycling factor